MADPVEATRELVMTFWQSWQKDDFETMRECLADDVDFNTGEIRLTNGDQVKAMVEDGTPWRDVRLVGSFFEEGRAALFYEGTDTGTGNRVRVAEYLEVAGGRIRKAFIVIAPPLEPAP